MQRALVLRNVTKPRLPPVAAALLVAIAAVVLLAPLVPGFAAPNPKLAPHHLPIVLTSPPAGALLVLLVRSRPARLVGLVGFGVLAGLLGALVLRDWLHIISGPYLPAALVLGLITLAVSAGVAGLGTVAGHLGISLG